MRFTPCPFQVELQRGCPNSLVTDSTAPSLQVFQLLPGELKEQLLLDRDPHGNVQVHLPLLLCTLLSFFPLCPIEHDSITARPSNAAKFLSCKKVDKKWAADSRY